MKIEIVIIDDDLKLKEDPLVWSLMDKYGEDNIKFINNSQEGIDYVLNNLGKNIIIILDYEFSVNEKKGDQVFDEITNITKLVPIIFFTGISKIENETYRDLINNHAFGIVNKMATSEELLKIVFKAELFYKNSLDNAIEDWIIEKPEDKDKPFFFTSNGISLSLNEILFEIRNQTELGKSFARKLNELTIELLLNNKERLND
ncbi:response regulator [Flavobacterium jejuense]|uniref:Response regulator n=1 Tax=Flavobacterium jejuense TaxID=1544455 RepID=A0ABX0IT79_9FLAO|nr:response regulator [Flavobacterium jejuense]NHN27082.1 response regulator [Flavobacterium jejuense]